MKVDKAPTTHYFKFGWIEFHKSRNTNNLYFAILQWTPNPENNYDGLILGIITQGKVNDEKHLADLQGIQQSNEIQLQGSVSHD